MVQTRSARSGVASIAAVAVSALVLAVCLVGTPARRDELAYDGPFDTPPVTWYYPATSNNVNTLGYTWDNAQMQNTEVVYEPGMMTDQGIAHTTEDTVGFLTGETTTAYPLGTGIEYQNGEETVAGLAGKRPLHPATLKFIKSRDEAAANGSPATFQSLADSDGVNEMDEALKAAKGKDSISGKEDMLTKKLDAAFDSINGKSAMKLHHAHKSYSDLDAEMEDMRLSDDLVGAAGSAQARSRRGRRLGRRGQGMKAKSKKQSLAYSVDPYEVNPSAQTSAKVEVNGDTAMQMSYSSGNIAGPSVTNLADSDDTSGPKWSTGNVQLQSPALMVNQLPPPLPAPSAMMHMPMYPGQPPYSFHVNHGGYPPSVKGEIWSYSDSNGNKNGPSYWGKLRRSWGVCRVGMNQSPINVELNVRRDDKLKMLRWLGPNDPYQATVISPLYKNVLTIEGLKGSMMVSGMKMELKSGELFSCVCVCVCACTNLVRYSLDRAVGWPFFADSLMSVNRSSLHDHYRGHGCKFLSRLVLLTFISPFRLMPDSWIPLHTNYNYAERHESMSVLCVRVRVPASLVKDQVPAPTLTYKAAKSSTA